tara:strand:+ start:805 stop:1245 length:441 start_codon:yes stop_codon:yes gene_type:complete
MDFKEFLLLEGDAEESKDQAKKRDEKRKFKPRPGDPKAPESSALKSTAKTLIRLTHGSLQAAKKSRKYKDADTRVQIAASTNLINPAMKRLFEIVASTEVSDQPSSSQAAIGMRKLNRKLRTGTSAERGSARGMSAGQAVGKGALK